MKVNQVNVCAGCGIAIDEKTIEMDENDFNIAMETWPEKHMLINNGLGVQYIKNTFCYVCETKSV